MTISNSTAGCIVLIIGIACFVQSPLLGIVIILIGIGCIYGDQRKRRGPKQRDKEKRTTCPYCGTTYSHGIGTCLKCGKKITGTTYVPRTQQTQYPTSTPTEISRVNSHSETCPHCGVILKEGAIYCAECGKKIQ